MSSAAGLAPHKHDYTHWALAALVMLAGLAVSSWMRPTQLWADKVGLPDLERIIPVEFGDWVQSRVGGTQIIDPQQAEALQAIYTSTLSRVYTHKPTGRRVMLSVAYGKDQSIDTQVHPPEACYRSQGFRVNDRVETEVATPLGALKAVRLHTTLGLRAEPLTYFIRVGDTVARGSLERNLVRMQFAARGYLVDGLLFRVSEVTNRPDAYEFQDRFIGDVLATLPPAERRQLIGRFGS